MVTDTELLILSALRASEMYGREIIAAVADLTNGRRRLSAAGLYTTLHRMEKKGFIAGRWGADSENRGGARRRYYEVTGVGERALKDVADALRVSSRQLGFRRS